MRNLFILLLFCGLSSLALAQADLALPPCHVIDDSNCKHRVPAGNQHCLRCETQASIRKSCSSISLSGDNAILCNGGSSGPYIYFCPGTWSQSSTWVCK